MDYQQLLVEHLELIDKVVRFVARRHHLSPADTEDFASLVRFRLVDRDFAVLRKFKQRSAFSTYVTIVIERICLDFCIARWGKWRPSAVARRLGAEAILLEQLIVRDGITFDEAVGTLQTNHSVHLTRAELHAVLLQLPVRTPRRRAGYLATSALDDHTSTAIFVDDEDERVAVRVNAALRNAVSALPPEDQEIVRLRFGAGRSVAEIARLYALPPKTLYRRLQRIAFTLRLELQQRGVQESEITLIVGHPTLALTGVFDDEE